MRVSLWMHSHIIFLVVAAGSRPQTFTLPWKRTDTNAHQYWYGNNRFYVCSTSILGILSLLGVFSLHMTQIRLLFKPFPIPLLVQGGMEGADRDRVVTEFRDGVTKILISTDVLSRGFDVSQVMADVTPGSYAWELH